jgi:coenzyme F420 hydrogenase subunit beta
MSKRLEMEVWSLDKCSGCGMCVATCSKQVLGWGEEQHPIKSIHKKTVGYTKVDLDNCAFCEKFCEETCPRLVKWSAIEPIAILSARAEGPVKSGIPNDVIRSIMTAGRSAGLLDGVVMLDLEPWELAPIARVASTVEEIVDSLGPQYLWAPVFQALNEAIFQRGMTNIGVVCTPCAAEAVRKLRESTNPRLKPYQDAIRLTVTVFCTGIYQPQMLEETLIKPTGISRKDIRRLEVSPDGNWLNAILWDGKVHTVPRQQAEKYTRSGCSSCDDFLGESADLAVGLVGAPQDASSLIVRTPVGEIFVRNAVRMRLLEIGKEVDEVALSAATGDKDRRERAQEFQDLKILMLDSLADPLQRGEAIKQFVRLYRTPVRSSPTDKTRNSCTGC